MDTRKLKIELDNDPKNLGYTGADENAVTVIINGATQNKNVAFMTGTEVLNAIVQAELEGLTPERKEAVWNVIHMGSIDPFGREKDILVWAFRAGSGSVAALASLRVSKVSRASEIGLGTVKPGHVLEARRLV